MISANTRSSFDYLLDKAIRGTLVATAEDTCAIEPGAELSAIRQQESVVLTISSYLFRLVFFFHFTANDAATEHFARVIKAKREQMDPRAFYAAIYEFGNVCAGTLNRDLTPHFVQLGMSTPSFLGFDSTAFLDVLSAGHTRHYQIDLNSSARFHATLCVCAYGDLDFTVDRSETAESTGELELF